MFFTVYISINARSSLSTNVRTYILCLLRLLLNLSAIDERCLFRHLKKIFGAFGFARMTLYFVFYSV